MSLIAAYVVFFLIHNSILDQKWRMLSYLDITLCVTILLTEIMTAFVLLSINNQNSAVNADWDSDDEEYHGHEVGWYGGRMKEIKVKSGKQADKAGRTFSGGHSTGSLDLQENSLLYSGQLSQKSALSAKSGLKQSHMSMTSAIFNQFYKSVVDDNLSDSHSQAYNSSVVSLN